MQGTSRAEQSFKPGETVSESGVYTVVHDGHRQKHSATIFKGEKFPQCARCGDNVRFVLLRPSTLISEDVDFKQDPDAPPGQAPVI